MLRVLQNMQEKEQMTMNGGEQQNVNNNKKPQPPLRLTDLIRQLLGETFSFKDLDALHELLQGFNDVVFVSF